MFSVPLYGVKPSFSAICFFTHGSLVNFDASCFPETTVPLIDIVFKESESSYNAPELLERKGKRFSGVVYFCSFSQLATFLIRAFEDMSMTGTIIFSFVSIMGWNFGMSACPTKAQ